MTTPSQATASPSSRPLYPQLTGGHPTYHAEKTQQRIILQHQQHLQHLNTQANMLQQQQALLQYTPQQQTQQFFMAGARDQNGNMTGNAYTSQQPQLNSANLMLETRNTPQNSALEAQSQQASPAHMGTLLQSNSPQVVTANLTGQRAVNISGMQMPMDMQSQLNMNPQAMFANQQFPMNMHPNHMQMLNQQLQMNLLNQQQQQLQMNMTGQQLPLQMTGQLYNTGMMQQYPLQQSPFGNTQPGFNNFSLQQMMMNQQSPTQFGFMQPFQQNIAYGSLPNQPIMEKSSSQSNTQDTPYTGPISASMLNMASNNSTNVDRSGTSLSSSPTMELAGLDPDIASGILSNMELLRRVPSLKATGAPLKRLTELVHKTAKSHPEFLPKIFDYIHVLGKEMTLEQMLPILENKAMNFVPLHPSNPAEQIMSREDTEPTDKNHVNTNPVEVQSRAAAAVASSAQPPSPPSRNTAIDKGGLQPLPNQSTIHPIPRASEPTPHTEAATTQTPILSPKHRTISAPAPEIPHVAKEKTTEAAKDPLSPSKISTSELRAKVAQSLMGRGVSKLAQVRSRSPEAPPTRSVVLERPPKSRKNHLADHAEVVFEWESSSERDEAPSPEAPTTLEESIRRRTAAAEAEIRRLTLLSQQNGSKVVQSVPKVPSVNTAPLSSSTPVGSAGASPKSSRPRASDFMRSSEPPEVIRDAQYIKLEKELHSSISRVEESRRVSDSKQEILRQFQRQESGLSSELKDAAMEKSTLQKTLIYLETKIKQLEEKKKVVAEVTTSKNKELQLELKKLNALLAQQAQKSKTFNDYVDAQKEKENATEVAPISEPRSIREAEATGPLIPQRSAETINSTNNVTHSAEIAKAVSISPDINGSSPTTELDIEVPQPSNIIATEFTDYASIRDAARRLKPTYERLSLAGDCYFRRTDLLTPSLLKRLRDTDNSAPNVAIKPIINGPVSGYSSMSTENITVENGYCPIQVAGHACSDRSCNSKHQIHDKASKTSFESLLKTLHVRTRFSLEEVLSARSKSKDSSKRYFDATEMHSEEIENFAKQNPKNHEAWIRFALDQIPDHLSTYDKSKLSASLGPALKILNKAIANMPHQFSLLQLQLELIQFGGTENEIRLSMERAVAQLPMAEELWWRYYRWETLIERKQNILLRMLSQHQNTHKLLDAHCRIIILYATIDKDDCRNILTSIVAHESENSQADIVQKLRHAKPKNLSALRFSPSLIGNGCYVLLCLLALWTAAGSSIPVEIFDETPLGPLPNLSPCALKWPRISDPTLCLELAKRFEELMQLSFATAQLSTFSIILQNRKDFMQANNLENWGGKQFYEQVTKLSTSSEAAYRMLCLCYPNTHQQKAKATKRHHNLLTNLAAFEHFTGQSKTNYEASVRYLLKGTLDPFKLPVSQNIEEFVQPLVNQAVTSHSEKIEVSCCDDHLWLNLSCLLALGAVKLPMKPSTLLACYVQESSHSNRSWILAQIFALQPPEASVQIPFTDLTCDLNAESLKLLGESWSKTYSPKRPESLLHLIPGLYMSTGMQLLDAVQASLAGATQILLLQDLISKYNDNHLIVRLSKVYSIAQRKDDALTILLDRLRVDCDSVILWKATTELIEQEPSFQALSKPIRSLSKKHNPYYNYFGTR